MYKRNIFKRKFYEFTGAIHNHSKYSFDCEVEPSKIVKVAKKAKLDYFTINDHMVLNGLNDENFSNCNNPIAIVGIEINDVNQNNHYLVFNTKKIIKNQYPCQYVSEYKKDGSVGFIAHPFEKRMSKLYRTYSWDNKDFLPVDGLEIWNFASSWMAKLNPLFNGILLVLCPTIFVRKPHRANMQLWEDFNNNNQTPAAIGSTDAHGFVIKKCGIKFKVLTHKKLFKTIRTNVLLNTDTPTKQNIVLALKNGNSYIVNYTLGNPYNFWAGVNFDGGKGVIFGEKTKFVAGMKYYYRLPKTSKVILIKNGKKIASQVNDKGCFELKEKGRYRLEVKRFSYGWIYTNYIYLY